MSKMSTFKVRFLLIALIFLCLILNLSSFCVMAQTVVATINLASESEDGLGASDIAINSETNRIYITNEINNNVIVIDGETNKIISTISVGNTPTNVTVNSNIDRIYVVNMGSNDISVIDGSTNLVINTIDTTEFEGEICAIVVNPDTNLIYVAKSIFEVFEDTFIREGSIIMIDGSTNEIIKIIKTRPELVALHVNPQTNRIYALSTLTPNQPSDEFDNKVNVIDGFTNEIISTINVGLAREPSADVAVNSVTNRIYVSNQFVVSTLDVIDGVTNQVIATVNLSGGPRQIGINHSTNHIYVIEGPNVVDAIDGSTNKVITSVKLQEDFNDFNNLLRGISVNPDTNLIYVVSTSGNLTVILDEIDALPIPTLSPVPTVTVVPTSTTLLPTPTVTVAPTPKQTPHPFITSLTVNPTSDGSSLRFKKVTVTTLDQNGLPISDIIVQASANGLGAAVTPSSATTGADGTVKFKFRFGFVTKNAEITFTTNDLIATITQE